MFLEQKYGKNTELYQNYAKSDQDAEKFYQHILQGSQKLEDLYQSFTQEDQLESKRSKKNKMIREIVQSLDTITFKNPEKYNKYFEDRLPNNAYFMIFRRYRAKQNQFEEEFQQKFEANFKKYLAYLKEKYS